ncbi:MAG TPA: hypothetical protein VH741_09865 [Candidatus Limnocylindrales bacterium]|jgi:hypothetical protein
MDLRWFESARIEHRHGESWYPMDEKPDPTHRPADPEREWASGRVFHCGQCDEYIRVSPPPDSARR